MQTKTRSQAPPKAPSTPRLPGVLPLLDSLNVVARSLASPTGSEGALAAAIEGVRSIARADGIAILARQKPGDYLFLAAEGVLSEWSQYALSGVCCQLLDALHDRDRVTLFKRSQRSPWAKEFLFAAGMEWGALAPIRLHDQNVGALLVNHSIALPMRSEHVAALQSVATLAGVAIVEGSVRAELEGVFMGVIMSLTMALEAKDPYTEGHSARVAAYSEAIGKQLGLPPRKLDTIHRSCLLHDIGKIAVEERILAKGGTLSESEREKLDRHTLIGEDILRPIAPLKPLLPGVRSHHENFDGSGYPDGLKGEAIPIEARIIAVADAFDAMTSNRPYRAALDEEEALLELRERAGSQFDPRIVAAFEQIYPAVKRTLEHLRPKKG